MQMLFAKLLILLNCVVFLESHLFNSSNEKKVVTMESEMPDFVSIEPTPNRNKEITVLFTFTFGGFFQVRTPATETIRIVLQRLSKMPNWLPGYNLRFELIEDGNVDEIAIPGLLTKIRHFSNHQSLFPIALLTEATGIAQLIPATILKEFNFISQTIYQNTIELEKRQADLTNNIGLGPKADFPFLFLVPFFKQMGWTKVSLISEIHPYWSSVSFKKVFLFIKKVYFNFTVGSICFGNLR